MLKMKENESGNNDNNSDTEKDEKLINMLKVLPKRESARTSMNSFDVTSFVDLSTPKGGCRKKSGIPTNKFVTEKTLKNFINN